jgi:predicted TIM-barrel fold metal-dependent hydrolase
MSTPGDLPSPSGTVEDMLGRDAWLGQTVEPVLDPDQPIIDPHHHLWRRGNHPYLLPDLARDIGSGHRILATVFIECLAEYREEGPEHLKPVGETAWVAGLGPSPVAGIVGSADLRQHATLDETLAAHIEAGGGRLRGIRHAAALDPQERFRPSHHRPPPGLYRDGDFRKGFARLAAHGLSFDAWLYHPQIPDLTDLARAFPETVIILDHLGGPLRVRDPGTFQDRHGAIADLARCPNVVVKLGGLGMPSNGFGWERRARPVTADEMLADAGPWYRAALDAFGPARAMFESNFPVDRQSLSYAGYWNAMKRLSADLPAAERDDLFWRKAARTYRLPVNPA